MVFCGYASINMMPITSKISSWNDFGLFSLRFFIAEYGTDETINMDIITIIIGMLLKKKGILSIIRGIVFTLMNWPFSKSS